ncbi:putative abductin-like protein [Labilithrix luteola]|uniref:Putative abductin-like protein n=1 Tax=Labilithrix luteola TaxID=1391654 RepID=A0A0K1Q2M7_9BACT|nr:AgmX/PglI C-terminal domain-containing protein [Labilithrix luteola]AKU99982.1 putative abductin-like protein [Labilithrix luteola]
MEGKAKVALTFALYQGEQLVRRDTIAQDIVKVGKDPRSHLRVDDDLASRMHAVIEVAGPNDITLIDLGNEPGTLVNGQRVNKCKVRPGDQIQIGSTTIHLESAELAGAGAPAAASSGRADDALLADNTAVGGQGAATSLGLGPAAAANPFAPAAPPSAPPAANPFAASPAANPFASANPFAPANPFVASAADQAYGGYGINAPGGSDFDPNQPYTFSMVKSGPDVHPDEVESHAAAIEVLVKWDQNTLHVSHSSPPKSFFVGEEQVGCDYFVPSEVLGTTRAPVVVARGVSAALVMFPRSTGTVEIPGQGTVTFQDLISSGRARPSSELSGAHEFELPNGAKAHMEIEGSGLVFEVSAVNAGKAPPVGAFSSFEPAAYVFIGLSFLLHIGIVASMAFFMPKMDGDDSEAIDRDQLLLMQKMLNAAAEREQEEKPTEQVSDANADQKEGGTGTRAKGEEGSMGNPNTSATNKRYGVQGPADNPDPHLARQAALKEAQEFGMIGLINVGAGGDPNAPTAPWGREESSGNDPLSARGNMWGDAIGDAFGAGGLGLSGVGEGGGGRGEGIGLGNIGTLGHGAGTGTGQGFGNGHGRLGGAHATKAPSMRQGATQVNGRLPPEVIQRIVRQNFGRFRLCYENGLRTNPNLSGRVSVKFVIDRSGAVSTAQDGGSDLPDQGVVSCVVRGFGNLSFPQPEGGIVTVVYPIIFNPGD